ncbi:MAG: AzlD domain-containing protein [Eubacteriales bacterium]|nr:AzlD domain-containing protein [Eubacteriales bacterium]
MDDSAYLAAAIATMAVVTYIPRVLPLLLVRGRIQSTFLRSFLYYVPYAVLSGMTIPAIFSATTTPVSATAGLLVAIGLGLSGRTLLTVALGASGAVWLVERLLTFP